MEPLQRLFHDPSRDFGLLDTQSSGYMKRVISPLDGHKFPVGMEPTQDSLQFFKIAEGIAGTGKKEHGHTDSIEVFVSQLFRIPCRMERVAEKYQAI